MLNIVLLFVAALVFTFIVVTFGRYPPKRVMGMVREFSGMLNRKSRKLSAGDKIWRYLNKNGAVFHYGKRVTPLRLSFVSVILAVILSLVCMNVSPALGILSGVCGSLLPWFLLPVLNRSDNEKMLPDISMIYHALAMQIKAGVYVTDALSECYGSVRNPRLRSALLDLGGDIVMKSDIFGALEKFQSEFDNRYIDSLCITILQAMESGQAVELLSDISEQIRDMERAVLEKRKGRLDRSITFYQLGMLSCVLAVALYACINYMLQAAAGM